jgi:hypothetical protein
MRCFTIFRNNLMRLLRSALRASLAMTWCLFICFFLFQTVAWACPMCKAFIADEGVNQDPSRVARGYFLSILTMMSMPVLVVGSLGTAIYRAQKKNRQSKGA